MNLPKFLKEVDHLSEMMSKGELSQVIHDIARTLPETGRENFLRRLKEMSGKQAICEKEEYEELGFRQQYEYFKEKLENIENWEMSLIGSLNEEYDDWYCSDSEEFLYEDPEGVIDVIEEACGFLSQCIENENYKSGYEIAELLVGLQIMVGGEYQEYVDEPMSIDDLNYYGVSDLDYERLVVDAVYIAYCVNELSERPEAVYTMIENAGKVKITMEMVMQNGNELPEIEEFLKLWVVYLGDKTSPNAERLLKEALELRNDPEQLLEDARHFHIQHPGLYEQYLANNRGQVDDRKLYEAGREALETIETKYIVRSRTALLTAELALGLDMQKEAEKCWMEAFRSDTSVENYLRLVTECKEFSKVKDEAKTIYDAMRAQIEADRHAFGPRGEREENHASEKTVDMLAFLRGEFQYVKEQAMEIQNSLGWSYTFMKCGLAAFMLLLLEGGDLQSGCRGMCRKVVSEIEFNKEEYQRGTLKTISEDSQAVFWKCFCHWKNTVPFSEEEKQQYLQWAETLVEKRVIGIMEGNHRKYYGECAEYIAALGEVRESRGETGGKQRVMMEYKAMYSRRTAFHKELRGLGMKDR